MYERMPTIAPAALTDDALRRLHEACLRETQQLDGIPQLSFPDFCACVRTDDAQVMELRQDGEPAALLLFHLTQGQPCRLQIPVYGCWYRSIRDLSELFGQLLREVVQSTTVVSFFGYAHDAALYRYLTLTQFGVGMEYCVRRIAAAPSSGFSVRALSKAEIAAHWSELWALVSRIIAHLKDSPVFYFGDEFTEAAYRAFFLDDDTTVYAAQDVQGRFIGLIESNGEAEPLLLSRQPAHNVGEVIVLPEYRGSGLAQALLACCEGDLLRRGVIYDWVNHGTANPNAMGFWDQYFQPYCFEFERTITF